jgi:hypothetical protein
MKRPFVVAVSVVALSAGLMAGCGSDASPSGEATPAASATPNGVGALPPNQALKQVQAAVDDATSVRFSGSVADGSQTIDLDVQAETGGDATATLKVNGQQIDLLVVGDTGYLKADKAFWQEQAGPEAATLFQDKWIKFPKSSSDFAPFLELTKVSSLIQQDKGSTLKTGKPNTINGVAVFALVDSSPTDGGTLYAASSGEPLPVQLVGSGEASGGKIDFDDWNEPVTVTAPNEADVLDPSTIK